MLQRLKRLFGSAGGEPAARNETQAASPERVNVAGYESFLLAEHLSRHNDYPILDWSAVDTWLHEAIPEEKQAAAWGDCERAWLLHFRASLGKTFHLYEGPTAIVVSSLSESEARAMLQYMERTLKRVALVLEGMAVPPPWGKDLLIAFDDQQQYYDYVSYYYPESGEFAFSGGMHINAGCSHYVTLKSDLRAMETVLAHEMTHGCLSHLPIPLWLNEGLAVNTEQRLAGKSPELHTPEQVQRKHRSFWTNELIQEFWSGKSFSRPDDGQMLSYDLARILVEQFSRDWDSFKAFVLAADGKDGGDAAARSHLGIALGVAASAVTQESVSEYWEPNPLAWQDAKSPSDSEVVP